MTLEIKVNLEGILSISSKNQLDGFIYHMTSFINLENIFQEGALLAKEILDQRGKFIDSIANDEVQDFRSRIYIWDFSKGNFRSLHSYVPFYFATRTPMLHNKYIEGVQEKIIIFEVGRSVLKDPGVLFTDGNAAIQQLSKFGAEKVYIIPAALVYSTCRREYQPDGPYGTSQNCSNLYNDISFLDQLDWDGINDRIWIDDLAEYRRIRHAEVLIPDRLSLDKVEGIFVSTKSMAQAVNAVIAKYPYSEYIPPATNMPNLFYPKS